MNMVAAGLFFEHLEPKKLAKSSDNHTIPFFVHRSLESQAWRASWSHSLSQLPWEMLPEMDNTITIVI